MERVLFSLNGTPIAVADLLLGAAGLTLVAACDHGLEPCLSRARRAARRRFRASSASARCFARWKKSRGKTPDSTDRCAASPSILGSRQADLARLVAERLDAVGTRVGAGLEASGRTAGEHLAKLNERLAVIDAAQARVAALTQEVVGLKDILANKQARGAFGQGRLEAIIRDGLPASAFEFQYTLSNNTRPDCVIRLPGDPRLMIIDAKFPLEAFTALRGADERRGAQTCGGKGAHRCIRACS